MKTPEITFLDELMIKIKEVYEKESEEIVEKHKEEMSKELDYKMQEIVTRAGLRIEERLMIENYGQEIKITILKEK